MARAFWEEIKPADIDFKMMFPAAHKEAKIEAKAMKKIGKRWSSGREKAEFINRRALEICFDMVQTTRREAIANKDARDREEAAAS